MTAKKLINKLLKYGLEFKVACVCGVHDTRWIIVEPDGMHIVGHFDNHKELKDIWRLLKQILIDIGEM